MDVFAKYVSGIDNPDHRLKAEEILSWTAGQFPNLEAQIKWNKPTFTDHGTYIIMFAAAKNHLSILPEKETMEHLAMTSPRPGTALLRACSEFDGLIRCTMICLRRSSNLTSRKKLKIRGFGASGRDVEGGRHGRFQRLFIKYRQP
ncbi:hypothetical protein EFW58_02171 [Bacillus velezensis]|nr:hypothetical protein EFW58_02171 [Bacillus velezensis]